jgi:hypothetical protein
MIASLCLLACSKHNYHTVKTTKPRLHKGWYKDSRNFKHIKVWRIHIPLFEKQGTKVVKMKG